MASKDGKRNSEARSAGLEGQMTAQEARFVVGTAVKSKNTHNTMRGEVGRSCQILTRPGAEFLYAALRRYETYSTRQVS